MPRIEVADGSLPYRVGTPRWTVLGRMNEAGTEGYVHYCLSGVAIYVSGELNKMEMPLIYRVDRNSSLS